jgi:hypothetical protein
VIKTTSDVTAQVVRNFIVFACNISSKGFISSVFCSAFRFFNRVFYLWASLFAQCDNHLMIYSRRSVSFTLKVFLPLRVACNSHFLPKASYLTLLLANLIESTLLSTICNIFIALYFCLHSVFRVGPSHEFVQTTYFVLHCWSFRAKCNLRQQTTSTNKEYQIHIYTYIFQQLTT